MAWVSYILKAVSWLNCNVKFQFVALVSSRVWSRHVPTRALRKLARVEEVKSRMGRKFSKIENLWPREDSCSHTFTLFALFFLKSPSLLKPRRMNSQNIISGILAQFRSLPNNPVGRSCWWLPTMRRFLSSILIFPEMWYAHGYWSQTNVPYCCWNAWSTRSNDMPA